MRQRESGFELSSLILHGIEEFVKPLGITSQMKALSSIFKKNPHCEIRLQKLLKKGAKTGAAMNVGP